MAARQNSGSTKQNKQYARKWQGIDRVALWIGGLIIAAVVGYVLFSLLGGFNMIEQRKMESYLKSKYGEEFVVGKPKRKASGLGVEGYLEAEAYALKEKDLLFSVLSSSNGTSDNYVSEVWSREAEKAARPFLASLFGYVPTHAIEVNPSLSLYRTLGSTTPTFEKIIRENPKDIKYNFRVVVEGNFDNTSEHNNHLNRAFDILTYVRKVGVIEPAFRYVINDPQEDYRYLCQYYDDGVSINKAQSPQDLQKCFAKEEGRE